MATNALAKLGFDIAGVDIAEEALKEAEAEAEAMGVTVSYSTGSCYAIPADDASLDGVLMSDVLEHFHDLRRAVKEVYRILKPGGIFVLDTINRTPKSWIALILVAERLTGLIPAGTHDWRMFITPEEMEILLLDAGFTPGPQTELLGFGPDNPLARVPKFVLTPNDTSTSYLWWAQKK